METLPERAIVESRQGIARLSVAQFHRMIETGILREGAAVELIEGILVRKDASDAGGDPMMHGPKHADFLQRIVEWLNLGLATSSLHHVRQQLPLTLAESEPEPDIAVVRGRAVDYREQHPGPEDCAAILEIADSSLEYDRAVKAPLYAAAGIPAYWIVNLRDHAIESHADPIPEERRFANRSIFAAGATATLTLDGGLALDLTVDSLFV